MEPIAARPDMCGSWALEETRQCQVVKSSPGQVPYFMEEQAYSVENNGCFGV